MTKPIFDLDKILQPLDGNDPCGPYLFYEPVYDSIQEARREEDATLPQGVWEHTLKKADWDRVFSLCVETLQERSKDLQIAVWATEAATALFGVRGLAEGIAMTGMLADRFWETIHPKLQEDDPEVRNAPFDHADRILSECLHQTPCMRETSLEEHVFTWSDWIDVEHKEQIRMRQKSTKPDENKVRIIAAVDATPAVFYLEMTDRLNELNEELAKLRKTLEEKSGGSAPSFSQIGTKTSMMLELTKSWLTQRKGIDMNALPKNEMERKTGEPNAMESGQEAETEHPIQAACHINERMEAYMLLERAAEILVQCEPHSPVPYLIRRLVAWKNKSLSELMEELSHREIDLTVLRKLFVDLD